VVAKLDTGEFLGAGLLLEPTMIAVAAARRPKTSCDDVSALPRFVGIGGERFVGVEVLVAFDG
jgi:hypothetical protein